MQKDLENQPLDSVNTTGPDADTIRDAILYIALARYLGRTSELIDGFLDAFSSEAVSTAPDLKPIVYDLGLCLGITRPLSEIGLTIRDGHVTAI